MMEKIRLAVTFDDYKEAKLLADFAAERIAESNVLLAAGKTEEAAELLKEAVATQEQASEQLATETEGAADDEAPETEGTVEAKLAQNIDGLLNALSHVKNPTAQQAIMKNIQKSFAKLDKKLTKLEEKDAKFAEQMKQIEDQVDGQVSDVETVVEKAEHGKALSKHKGEEKSAVVEENNTGVETSTVEENNIGEEDKLVTGDMQTEAVETQTGAANKVAEKQAQAAVKATEKQAQATAKAAEKQTQAAAKAEQKHSQASTKGAEKQNNAGNGQGNQGGKAKDKENN